MRVSAVNVLVIDDDAFMLKLLKRSLEGLGFSAVTNCTSGAEALASLDERLAPPELIILDLKMPEMDGIEFLRHLVQRQYPGHLLLISGEDEVLLRSAEKLVIAHGLNLLGYLHKPIVPRRLGELLAALPNLIRTPGESSIKPYSAEQLAEGIAGGQLVNYYQPIVSVKTGQPVAVEALVRWLHPKDGLVAPIAFIGLAEESGLIEKLADAVIDQALAQAQAWKKQNIHLSIGINLSMDNLVDLQLVDRLSAKVASAGLDPESIILEITESRAMREPTITLDNLTRLRLKHFVLAIDDFGTGHATLTQLLDLPFNKFKLDRSFVHNAWSQPRIKSLFDSSLSMAKHLGLQVIAEGVETQEDWTFVRNSGCDQAQGYLIAKPMPAEDFLPWFREWEAKLRRELVPDESPSAAEGKNITALIIDDNELQCKVQSRILRAENYQTVTASSGKEALQILRTLRPHVILIDVEMPDLSGLEVLRRLRKTTVFSKTPVIMVSGVNTKNIVRDSMEAGANSFMVKPFDKATLLERVRKALKQAPKA